MKSCLFSFIILTGALFLSCEHQKPDAFQFETICFDTEVFPVFQNKCAVCHNDSSPEGGYNLSDFESISEAIVPGDPENSPVYEAVTNITHDYMPPEEPLTQEERTLIRLWIEQGANEILCYDSCSNYSFSETISVIISTNCIACHGETSPQGGVSLTNFSEIKAVADEGSLVDVIKQLNGKPLMPPSGSLSDCEIQQIENWVNAGTPNNK